MPSAHIEQTGLGMSTVSQDVKLFEKQGHIEPRFPKIPSKRGSFSVRLIHHHITNDFSPELPHNPPAAIHLPAPGRHRDPAPADECARYARVRGGWGVPRFPHSQSTSPIRVLTHSLSLSI